jgi:hypothetical protein
MSFRSVIRTDPWPEIPSIEEWATWWGYVPPPRIGFTDQTLIGNWPAAGQAIFVPFVVRTKLILTGLAVYRISVSTSGTWRWDLALYSDVLVSPDITTSGLPPVIARIGGIHAPDRIIAGPVTVTVGTVSGPPDLHVGPISTTLGPGLYWVACLHRSTGITGAFYQARAAKLNDTYPRPWGAVSDDAPDASDPLMYALGGLNALPDPADLENSFASTPRFSAALPALPFLYTL